MPQRRIYDLASRFLSGYGIAACSVSATIASLRGVADDRLRLVKSTADSAEAIQHLSLLTWPATRHVAFAASANATAFVNNGRNGSDYADQKVWLASLLQTNFARIVTREGRVWSRGDEREVLQYEATIFELWGDDSTPIRSVACTNDGGRWSFNEVGNRNPFEDSFPYDAPRKRDRFTAEHIRQLTEAYGLPWVTPEVFLNANEYYLLKSETTPIDSCTIDEADDPARGYYLRGLDWARHMQTHASSVIADFERCIQINPDYEPKVRLALDEARRVITDQ